MTSRLLKNTIQFIFGAMLFSTVVFAQVDLSGTSNPPTGASNPPVMIPSPPQLDAKAYILMDALSGEILVQKNIDEKRPPASLTKLMTMYLISDALKRGAIQLDQPVTVSLKAWKTGGSKMFIKVGDQVSVHDLILGIIVTSGNDASVAIAEFLGGNEDSFAEMMNNQAKILALTNTHFTNSSGGAADPNHYASARDLAKLAKDLIEHFPQNYEQWYSQKWFTFNNIRQPNRNRLLWQYPEADGIKTGHTDEAGYCLAASAKKGTMRLISIILGAPSEDARSAQSIALFNYGFRFYQTHKLYAAETILSQSRIWFGTHKTLPAGVSKDFYVTLPFGQFQKIQPDILITPNLKAPIVKGQEVGEIKILLNNQVIVTQPLVALSDDPKGGWFRQLIDHILYFFHH